MRTSTRDENGGSTDPLARVQHFPLDVEVAGIEPASADAPPRTSPSAVQYERSARPRCFTEQVTAGPSRLKVPPVAPTTTDSSGSLADASYRDESNPGLTDFGLALGGEGKVGAL